jgi:hypothetical protein
VLALDAEVSSDLLGSHLDRPAARMRAFAVSRRVGNVRRDDGLIEPAGSWP